MLLFILLHFVGTFVVANTLSVGDNVKTQDNGLEDGAFNHPGSYLPEVLDTVDQHGHEQELANKIPAANLGGDTQYTTISHQAEDPIYFNVDHQSSKMKQTQPTKVELLGEDYFASAHSLKSATKTEDAHHGEKGLTAHEVIYVEEDNISPNQMEIVHQRLQRSVVGTAKSTPAELTKLFEGTEKTDKEIHLAEGGAVGLNISTTFSSNSPEKLSSTTSAPLDDNHQSMADFTHSVEGGGVPLDRGSLTRLANLTQTSLATTLLTETTTSNISMEYISQEDPNNVATSTPYNDPKLHKTVPRKGAEAGKIVGRKGVDDISASLIPTTTNDASPSVTLTMTSNHSIDGVLAAHLNSSSTNTTLLPSHSFNEKVEIIDSNPPLKKKPNPKPLTLTDKTSFNTTPAPHDHVSSQRDLVVPVVALILAVPLVTILGIFMYKKGSEYWSRRHYRRMDFLIDGMYND